MKGRNTRARNVPKGTIKKKAAVDDHTTYIRLVDFHDTTIETTVTDNATVADNWIHQIGRIIRSSENRIVGMDCKYIRHPINSLSGKIALLQLCVHNKCLVLQLLRMVDQIPQSVKDFLNDSSITFVGVEIEEKSKKLSNEYMLNTRRRVDIHFLAKTWFPFSYKTRPMLKALAYGIAGLSMIRKIDSVNNSINIGDWESRVLSDELVTQACVDAYASWTIGHKLFRDYY